MKDKNKIQSIVHLNFCRWYRTCKKILFNLVLLENRKDWIKKRWPDNGLLDDFYYLFIRGKRRMQTFPIC